MAYGFQTVDPQTFYTKGMQKRNSALQSYTSQDRSSKGVTEAAIEAPPKTAGGAIGSGAGGALAGAAYGAMEGTKLSPGWGSLIGGVVGALAYFLS